MTVKLGRLSKCGLFVRVVKRKRLLSEMDMAVQLWSIK